MVAAALALLLLAPEGAHELRLRFEKGLVYEDASAKSVKFKAYSGGKVFRYDSEEEHLIRRTVLELGEDGLPLVERVEVVKFIVKTNEAPDREPGVKQRAAHGRSFVWRKRKSGEGFALYDSDRDVTEEHPELVQRLLNWRSARLPAAPVEVGATWEVAARDFLEAVGQQKVPEGLEGKATYTLAEVADGIATISFEFKSSRREGESVVDDAQQGVWLFDVTKGRELKIESEGKVEVDGGKRGFGTFRMVRTITYR